MTPAIAADRHIYFGSRDQAFNALLPTPERPEARVHRPWGLWLHGAIISSPVIAPDNTVYIVTGVTGGLMALLRLVGMVQTKSGGGAGSEA